MNASHPGVLLGGAVACGVLGFGLPRLLPGQVPALVVGLLFGTGLGLGFAALLRWRLPDSCDVAPAGLRRRYTRELLLAMGAYVAVLLLSVTVLKRVDMDPALRAVVALLPVPPIAFALRAIVRYIRDVDELQQRIELEAVSIATAFVCLLYMSGGFLQAAKVIDVPASAAMIWVFPLVCFAYGLAKVAVSRRYQ
ncbi:hypothetical protein [Pseudoxanthomonas sp. J35]|uniref:hypothetical protein n=1 Tax=Pseudoxanthomonas sp. J35 TaxID=935852 RepID=UPI00048E10E3|nr:hypothetical protein [Pseudoxanthomonas sp. J35]